MISILPNTFSIFRSVDSFKMWVLSILRNCQRCMWVPQVNSFIILNAWIHQHIPHSDMWNGTSRSNCCYEVDRKIPGQMFMSHNMKRDICYQSHFLLWLFSFIIIIRTHAIFLQCKMAPTTIKFDIFEHVRIYRIYIFVCVCMYVCVYTVYICLYAYVHSISTHSISLT